MVADCNDIGLRLKTDCTDILLGVEYCHGVVELVNLRLGQRVLGEGWLREGGKVGLAASALHAPCDKQ